MPKLGDICNKDADCKSDILFCNNRICEVNERNRAKIKAEQRQRQQLLLKELGAFNNRRAAEDATEAAQSEYLNQEQLELRAGNNSDAVGQEYISTPGRNNTNFSLASLTNADDQVALGKLEDKSVEYQAAIDYLNYLIGKLQAITIKDELQTFIRKNDEIARNLFELSGRVPDETKVNNYCDFFNSNPNIDRSDKHQKRIIDLCTKFKQKLEAKESEFKGGGKRKRRNSQKKKKKKSNKKKKKKSKESRKKKRN